FIGRSALESPRAPPIAIQDRPRAANKGCPAQEGEVVVDAMPAHSDGHHSGCAAIRRQNAQTNVNSTSAGWERHRSSNHPPTARFPVRREGCAERTDLKGSGG